MMSTDSEELDRMVAEYRAHDALCSRREKEYQNANPTWWLGSRIGSNRGPMERAWELRRAAAQALVERYPEARHIVHPLHLGK